MGNKQALINHSSEISYASDFSDQIIEEGSKTHPYLGKIIISRITNSNRKRVFSKIFHVSEQNKSFPTIHIQRCSMQHQHLLNYYGCVKNTSKLLSNIESYEFYFEYLPQTLNQQIKRAPFEEADIWMIIEQITDFMVYLQSIRRYHGNLTSEGIFMAENKKIKLLDDFMQNNLKQNKLKEDIYDFGMIIIHMMTQRTNQLNFFEQLKKLIGQYSLQLLQFTSKLLQKDPDQRPDFFQLQELISNRFIVPITSTEFIQVQDTPNVHQSIRMITQDQFQQYKKIENPKQQEQLDPLFIQKTQPDIQHRESNQIVNMKTVQDEKIQVNQLQSQNNIPSLDLKNNNQQLDTNVKRSQVKKINYNHKYSVDQIPQSYLYNYQTQIKKEQSQVSNSSRINKTVFDQSNDNSNFMNNQRIQTIQSEDKKTEFNSSSQIQQNNIAIKQITSRIQLYPQNQQNDVKLLNKPVNDQSNISTLHSKQSMSRNMEFSAQYQSNYTSIHKKDNFSSCQNTRPFQNNQYQ